MLKLYDAILVMYTAGVMQRNVENKTIDMKMFSVVILTFSSGAYVLSKRDNFADGF